jgi:hydrogenase/urease accessory protein HupE
MAVVLATALAIAPTARAHDFKPALLALTAHTADAFAVVWRLPVEAAGDRLRPVFPEGSERVGAVSGAREGDMFVERFEVRRPGGLAGLALRIGGASPMVTEVLVRVELGPGHVITGRLRPGARDAFIVPVASSRGGIAATYLRLGVEHILTGADHLAFVLALVLLAGSAGAILRAVTAFTVAHSITLALAAVGWAHVPQPPVEATIALSIMFVARDLALRRPGQSPATTAMAFGFGLLHGLGFAGALAEVGLPAGELPLSLFCFNVGVELGQLGFVLLVLGLRRTLRPTLAALDQRRPGIAQGLQALPATAIGTLGAFWLLDRVTAFWR